MFSSGDSLPPLNPPLCYIKTHSVSGGKNSPRRSNSTWMFVMKLAWCGQVIEASCSSYRRTSCIPLITRMQRVYLCIYSPECALRAHLHVSIAWWCGHGGLRRVGCWKGFPASAFHWGTPNTRNYLAQLFLWPQSTSELQYRGTTQGSSEFVLKSRGRRWALKGWHQQK